MGKILAGALLMLLGMAGVGACQQPPEQAAISSFWKVHPFEEWTLGETLALLTDSPWSRAATLVEPGAQVNLGKMRYYVQWYSAPPVREALVCLQQLKGHVDAEGEAAFLQMSPDAYELYVFAAFFGESGNFRVVPLDAFAGVTREELRESVRLAFSTPESSFRPDGVELAPHPQRHQLVGIRLTFKQARRAVPPEKARPGEAQLLCPTQRGSLSAGFVLEKMQRRGQPQP